MAEVENLDEVIPEDCQSLTDSSSDDSTYEHEAILSGAKGIDEDPLQTLLNEIEYCQRDDVSTYEHEAILSGAKGIHEDPLQTLLNEIEYCQRDDVTSARHLVNKFKTEVLLARLEIPQFGEMSSVIENFWTVICRNICVRLVNVIEKDCDSVEGNEVVNTAKKLISEVEESEQSDDFYDYVCTDDLIQIGRGFASEEKPILRIAALYGCARLLKFHSDGRESCVDKIKKCSWLLTYAFGQITSHSILFAVANDHLIPFLTNEITHLIRSIKTSNEKFQTESEAWCIMHMGICHAHCGCYNSYAEMCEKAINIVKRKLKKNSKFCEVVAVSLCNAASAHLELGELKKAMELYERSKEAYDKARDISDQKDKQAAIKMIMNNKKIAEIKLQEPTNKVLETSL